MPEKANLPVLVRGLLFARRMTFALARLERMITDEAVWAWTPPEKRDAVTFARYSGQKGYLPGGKTFELGLFDWEKEILTTPLFSERGCILVGAAGGGREMIALSQMGHDVLAFEPTTPFFEEARKGASVFPGTRIERGSYRDFVRAVEEGVGPLAELLRDAKIDGVVFGWGSFSHVSGAGARQDLLSATRKAAPGAPLLMSFNPFPKMLQGRLDRIRPSLRRLYRSLGAPSVAEERDTFLPEMGFTHLFTREEVEALAAVTGYKIVKWDRFFDTYAVLSPIV